MRSGYLLILALSFALASCSNSDEAGKDRSQKDPTKKVSQLYENSLDFGSNDGVAGTFYLPEMLTLCIADSSNVKDLGTKLQDHYSRLAEEAKNIGAEINGPPGQIKYSNDPDNFKFECLIPIHKIPTKQPAFGKLVVLEAVPALAYNYVGPYEKLFEAYEKLKRYMLDHGLEANGPMREFYTPISVAKGDKEYNLTRILVPVKAQGT